MSTRTGPTPSTPGAEAVISLRGVHAELGARPVLRGIDLTVRRGDGRAPARAPLARHTRQPGPRAPPRR
ncbi:hypothetical protein ACFVIN_25910, partial [Streptomyces prasinus]